MITDLVFVYGTLKRGGRNHRLLSGAEFVGLARTERKYRLIDCGPYPALIEHAAEPLEITGELYRISASLQPSLLPALDELEDEGVLYRRIVVPVTPLVDADDSGAISPASAFTYLWLGRIDRFPLVAGAEWPLK